MAAVDASGAGGSGKSPHELLVAGEKLCLELQEHLDLALLPRLAALTSDTTVVRETSEGVPQVPDSTVRNHAQQVLESLDFARKMVTRLEEMLSDASQSVLRAATHQ